MLRLVSNEGWLKHLLLLYKWIIQPYHSLLWLQPAMNFVISTRTIHPLLKLKRLYLVSNEGCLKRLLLLYKGLLQPYLSLLWLELATHFAIFDSYNAPTFKTEALRLICNEGWLEHLLLLYRGLI